MRLRMV